MKNGKTIEGHAGHGPLSKCGKIIIPIILILVLSGCHSTRHDIVDSHEEHHITLRQSSGSDTTSTTATATGTAVDSVGAHADERSVISISRDDEGRIIGIDASRRIDLNVRGQHTTEQDSQVYGLGTTHKTVTAVTSDSVTETTEETTQAVKAGITWECILGWTLVAFLILFYVIDWLYRIWKRRAQ